MHLAHLVIGFGTIRQSGRCPAGSGRCPGRKGSVNMVSRSHRPSHGTHRCTGLGRLHPRHAAVVPQCQSVVGGAWDSGFIACRSLGVPRATDKTTLKTPAGGVNSGVALGTRPHAVGFGSD